MTKYTVLLCAAAAVAGLPACGGDGDRLTVYLSARLGPDGPPGQRSPVVTPVERERRDEVAAARQAALEVLVGPSPRERARGYTAAVAPQTRLVHVSVSGELATLELAGREPTLLGAAALVYSLTELPEIARVRLLHEGRPCCVYSHSGRAIQTLMRETFRGWSGEPCSARGADSVACRAR